MKILCPVQKQQNKIPVLLRLLLHLVGLLKSKLKRYLLSKIGPFIELKGYLLFLNITVTTLWICERNKAFFVCY
jgi:hypothetical protein